MEVAHENSPESSSAPADESNNNDDEDEDVCRICLNTCDVDSPLMYPCACSGSIKFVHSLCLLHWLVISNSRHHCEVCKHPFSFSAVYAENTPRWLPLHELIIGMGIKAYPGMRSFTRFLFVLSTFLLFTPFITFWIWRFSFVRSFYEAQRLFCTHISTGLFLTDSLNGFLLSASIVLLIKLSASFLREYFQLLREVGGHEGNRNLVDEGNGEDIVEANGVGGVGQMQDDRIEADVEQMVDVLDDGVGGAGRMQDDQIEAHVELIVDVLDDGVGVEEVLFAERVGIRGPVFRVVEIAYNILARNTKFLGALVLVPFHVGRFILFHYTFITSSATISQRLTTVLSITEQFLPLANSTLKNTLTAVTNFTTDNNLNLNNTALISVTIIPGDSLSDAATLAVGYMFCFALIIFYVGVMAVVRYSRGEPVITSIAEIIEAVYRMFLAAMRRLVTMIKVVFLLVILLVVFPLMCGWWLDVCTISIFGKSIDQRVNFFWVSPLASSLIHWIVGLVFMLQIDVLVILLEEVLRNGVLYFLRDPLDDDPPDLSVYTLALRVLFSVVLYASSIVMLVFLPVKLAMRMAPSIFPLDISVSDPFTEIPAVVLLFQIFISFAVEHFKTRETIKVLLKYWFTAAGCALGLTDYLLRGPEEIARQENENDPARHDRIHEQLGGHLEGQHRAIEEDDNDKQSDSGRYWFVLRIVVLLLVTWMTLLMFNTVLVVVPVSVGRVLFNAVPVLPITHGIKCNDVYAFVIGSYVIWTALAGIMYCIDQMRTKRVRVVLDQIWIWCSIVIKSFVLLSIWIFVIPVLIGLLFELLLIVPMRVRVDESPVFLLYQDWALGFVLLKIWTRLAMLNHALPLIDDTWRVKFHRVKQDGFSRLQAFWVLREIVVPIISRLLTALCIPYVLARGVFPVFGYPLVVNSAVYRFAWLGCLGLIMLCFCAKRFHVWFINLHNSIRDDRYLIGLTLHNFGEANT